MTQTSMERKLLWIKLGFLVELSRKVLLQGVSIKKKIPIIFKEFLL